MFPQTPREVAVELYLNDTWTDITTDVKVRDGIRITRGKADEASRTAPSQCYLSVNNANGKYLPNNPLGAYYGQLGLNTPIRAGITSTALRFDEYPDSDETCTAPDTAGLSMTNDMDIRIDLTIDAPDSWDSTFLLVSKWGAAGQRSWYIAVVNGIVRFVRSTDGTASTTFDSTEAIPGPLTGRRAIRVSFARDNGAGGANCTFYTGDDIDEPVWQQLGSTVTVAGVADTFDSTASVAIGYASGVGIFAPLGAVYECEIRGDLGAVTMKASPDFTAQTAGASSFQDAQGNTWTVGGGAALASTIHRLARFYGELSSLPLRWDVSGNDAWVPITAAGILRRINSGSAPVTTGLNDLLMSTTRAAYWPLTDGEGSTSGANAGSGTGLFRFDHIGPTASATFGSGDLGRYLSAALSIVRTGTSDTLHYVYGQCSTTSAQTSISYEFVYRASALGPMKFKAEVYNAGLHAHWIVYFRGDGTNDDIQLTLIEDVYVVATTTNLADTAALDAITDGELHHVRLTLTQNGSATDYAVYIDGTAVITGSRASFTIGQLQNVYLTYQPGASDSAVALGYMVVWTGSNAPAVADTSSTALAHIGETAGRRIERLCEVTSVPFQSDGNLDETVAMGAQFEDTFDNQIAEIETTDHGVIFEPRDVLALGYRTRTDLYNQAARATIDYSAGELAAPLELVVDDQQIRNDVFAQRRDGSSYQATESTGPLSVEDPPDGVGRYKDEVQVNPETDDLLPPIAGWLLHLGTVDEPRCSQLPVDLARLGKDGKTTLSAALLAVDVGDRVVITNTDELNVYDDVALLVLGYTEDINVFEHHITFNCVPASPYEVFELNDADSRVDPGEGSTLSAGINSSVTSFTVASSGFLWTTSAGDAPISIMIGGEEMSVGAISGATSPQTFSNVTRSVNGVVKAHSSGAVVRLKRPGVLAL